MEISSFLQIRNNYSSSPEESPRSSPPPSSHAGEGFENTRPFRNNTLPSTTSEMGTVIEECLSKDVDMVSIAENNPSTEVSMGPINENCPSNEVNMGPTNEDCSSNEVEMGHIKEEHLPSPEEELHVWLNQQTAGEKVGRDPLAFDGECLEPSANSLEGCYFLLGGASDNSSPIMLSSSNLGNATNFEGQIGNYLVCPELGFFLNGNEFDLNPNLNPSDVETLNFQFTDHTMDLNADTDIISAMRKDPTLCNSSNVTVEQVLALIESDVGVKKLEFIKTMWHRICLGSYRVVNSNNDPSQSYRTGFIITRYGIIFAIRHTSKNTQVKLCIPICDILNFKIYNGSNYCVIGLQTGTRHASWVRKVLGMETVDNSVSFSVKSSEFFYCPLQGIRQQKWMTFLLRSLSQGDFNKLKNLFMMENGKDVLCHITPMNEADARNLLLFQ